MNRCTTSANVPQQRAKTLGKTPLQHTTSLMKDRTSVRSISKTIAGALLAALLLVIFGAIHPAMAASVTPTVIPGAENTNKTCAVVMPGTIELKQDNTNGPGPYNPSNGTLSVAIVKPSTQAGSTNSLDWTSNIPVLGVIVKDGNDGANFYNYGPGGSTGDIYLTTPNDGAKGVSHVSFCYKVQSKVPLTASKSAVGSYDRTIAWQLEKTVTPASHIGTVGENVGSSTWTVAVTKTETLGNYKVTGTITISNSNSYAASFSVSDVLSDGTVATVTCPSTNNNTGTVPANDKVVCTYTASPTGATATKNTATITSKTSGIDGAVAEAPVSFSENVIGDQSVTVDDDRDTEGQFPQVISETTTFDYQESFTCSSTPSDYSKGIDTDDYLNTATVTGDKTKLSDDAKVTVTCYAPIVSKDAEALHKQKYGWTITKDADGDYTKFIGDPATTHSYTVTVDQTLDESFTVSGTITVVNPRPDAAMSVSLADIVDGIPATLSCSNPLVVPAAASATCDYIVQLQSATDGTNIVTATVNSVNFEASAAYVFGKPIVDGFSQIDVTDTNGEKWEEITSDDSFEYTKDFSCPTDLQLYNEGVYVATDYVNTATIDQTQQSDTATVKLTCYAPVVKKDAEAQNQQAYSWTITKDADGAYSKFIGDPATMHPYTVTVDQSVAQLFVVSGTISVRNPRPDAPMTVSLQDVVQGVPATLACSNPLSVAANSTATCDYRVELPSAINGTNVVTATFNSINFQASAAYEFGAPEVSGSSTITVTDTNGKQWTNITGDQSFFYEEPFTCPTDPSIYSNGIYVAADHVNTATINETGQNDSAVVKLTCYAPVVSKNAQTEWLREYAWEITKSVEPSSHSGFAGDIFTSTYSVTVNQSITDSGYRAFGLISVANPAGSPRPITVDVTDELSGSVAVVDCDAQSQGNQTTLTVQPGESKSCTYSVNLPDATDRTNVATVSFQQIAFPANAAVDFGDPIILGNPTINVVDFFDGAQEGQPLGSASQDTTFTYSRPFECPVEQEAYSNGFFERLFPNVARIIETQQQDDASVSIVCELRAGLGDFVWFDKNQNGQQDAGEPGIAGVTVELLQNGSVISTTTTNVEGYYSFTGLLAGTYAVRFPTTGLTIPDQGDDATDSDASLTTGMVTTTLEAGEFNPTLDAGYIPASLGDFVWEDTNENGIQDSGEAAVPGMAVRLLQGGNVISTTVTNGSGQYRFENLQAGEYVVCFVLPGGYDFTDPNVGDDHEVDSDAIPSDSDPTLGCTGIITLEFGEIDLTWDVGLVKTNPTAEDEVEQPRNAQQLFLPSLSNQPKP